MKFYDESKFINFFDTKKTLDEEVGMVQYKVTSKEGLSLSVFMIICENTICINFHSKHNILISFFLDNIAYIKFDENDQDMVKFLFYKQGKDLPIVTLFIKPNLAVHVNLEQ